MYRFLALPYANAPPLMHYVKVTGLGLMVGVEIAGRQPLSAGECMDLILERMKNAGYLLGKTGPGRNVLAWMPPLTVGEDELMEAAEALERVLHTIR